MHRLINGWLSKFIFNNEKISLNKYDEIMLQRLIFFIFIVMTQSKF